MTETKSSTKRGSAAAKGANVWTDEERAAMQESARERKKSAKLTSAEERAAGEADIQAKIEEMTPPEQAIARRLHELVTSAEPGLMPRTYYGMPAYAKDGKVLCFFQPASKFKVRYSTFGFQPDARLDDGEMWPCAFALRELTPAAEQRVTELVKKAAA
jgi:uncharacterized protein YdhG (YjbR/CyaY superfamily)